MPEAPRARARRGWPGGGGGTLRSLLSIAATYVFFLLWAQFGFLTLVREHLSDPEAVQKVMAAMGLAGLAGSLLTARLLAAFDGRRLLAAGLAACLPAALLPLAARTLPSLALAAALIGLATAVVTVSLAAGLRALLPEGTRGVGVGLATGLAYLVSNLPGIFDGPAGLQAGIAALFCAAALLAWLPELSRPSLPPAAVPTAAAVEPRRPGFGPDRAAFLAAGVAGMALAFLALIGLDSAAFAVIQQTGALKAATWGSGGRTLLLGLLHLAAAVAAGRWIDRGRFASLLVATFGLFAVAFTLLEHGLRPDLSGPLYAVGISIYSVALVVYPAARTDAPGLVPMRWRAALVFGIAGWIGSALGVGAAQRLHHIPPSLLAAAGGILAAGLLLARPQPARPAAPAGARALHLLPLLVLGAASLLPGAAAGPLATAATRTAAAGSEKASAPPALAAESVARGRRVYVAEGCIHCHSQYVRPGTSDEVLWGPARGVGEGDPPLIGVRRQGPDLLNVGNRRSAAWHRLHLTDPRVLIPTSRMPSYAHLFREPSDGGASTRGDDLVAYLSQLGADTTARHLALARETRVAPPSATSPERGRRLFGAYCAPCHGAAARGDGPLAPRVGRTEQDRKAMNLRKEHFWLLDWGPGTDSETMALARLIKWGVPGTDMPGHETLSDQELFDLAAFIEQLRRADAP